MDFNVDGDFNKIICFKEEGSDSNAVPKGSDFVSTRTAYQDNTSKCYISDSASNFTEATKKLKGKGVDLDNNRFLILQDMKNEAEVYMQEELSLLKWQEKATKLAHEDATLRMADLQENITSIEENLKTERYGRKWARHQFCKGYGHYIFDKGRHMIKHLAENHQRFLDELKTKLLCISRELIYSAENERMVDTAVLRLHGVKKIVLLAVHQRLIVRILEFVDEVTANRVFQRDHFLHVRIGANVQKLELRRPTETEFRSLARNFVDENV